MSVDLGHVDGFVWRDHPLAGLRINPWLIAVGDALGIPHNSCVTVSRQLLMSLGYDVDDVRTPQDLIDWSINQ